MSFGGGALPPRPPPGTLKQAPGPHAVMGEALLATLRNYFLFVSPERSSERDYVITDSVRSMCMW